MKALTVICLLLAFFIAVPTAYAGEGDFDNVKIQPISDSDTATSAPDIILGLLIGIGILFLIIAGIVYMSGGEHLIFLYIGLGCIIIPIVLIIVWAVLVFVIIIGFISAFLK